MKYPKHLYYFPKNETDTFSHIPNGVLSVSRLIANKPAWKTLGLDRKKKKKSLILAPWNASSWSHEKITAKKEALFKAMDDGFPLYLWQDGTVIALSKENLSLLDNLKIREKITPQYNHEIERISIEQHRLTKEQVLVLDDYYLQDLLKSEKQPSHTLAISDLLAVKDKDKEDRVLSILKQHPHPLVAIIHDEFSEEANKKKRISQEEIPKCSR